MASNDIDLLTYARRARRVGWSSIPVNQDKQPDIPKVVPFRDVLPSDLELERFFGLNKKQTTVALAVLVDGNKLAIDTDGEGEKIFITKVLPRLKPELKEKIKCTTRTKSPRGRHFLGKTKGGNDKIAKKEHTWKFVRSDGKDHDEIKIRLYGFYSIECGRGYDEVTAIEKS